MELFKIEFTCLNFSRVSIMNSVNGIGTTASTGVPAVSEYWSVK